MANDVEHHADHPVPDAVRLAPAIAQPHSHFGYDLVEFEETLREATLRTNPPAMRLRVDVTSASGPGALNGRSIILAGPSEPFGLTIVRDDAMAPGAVLRARAQIRGDRVDVLTIQNCAPTACELVAFRSLFHFPIDGVPLRFTLPILAVDKLVRMVSIVGPAVDVFGEAAVRHGFDPQIVAAFSRAFPDANISRHAELTWKAIAARSTEVLRVAVIPLPLDGDTEWPANLRPYLPVCLYAADSQSRWQLIQGVDGPAASAMFPRRTRKEGAWKCSPE